MNINKMPQHIITKIKAHLNVIDGLNSKELLDYSKNLNGLKEDIDNDTREYLFKAISLRTITINSGLQRKLQSKCDKMVREYLRSAK